MLYVKEVLGNVNDIVGKIEQAAKDNDFGVLDIHDLKQKMASKGVDFAPECRIVELCNPRNAKEVLENNMQYLLLCLVASQFMKKMVK